MKRYEPSCYYDAATMDEEPEGDYVRYEDVKAYDDLLAACKTFLAVQAKDRYAVPLYILEAMTAAIAKAKEA